MLQEFSRLVMEKLPDSGVYLLLVKKTNSESLKIGALGEFYFKKGYYIYVGSAQKNLKKRIERHLRKNKRKKWHIDYLLEHAVVEDVYVLKFPKIFEEKIACKLSSIYEYFKGFGSSDTKAPSHLFYINNKKDWDTLRYSLNDMLTYSSL